MKARPKRDEVVELLSDGLLPVTMVVRMARVSRRYLYRLVASGDLERVKIAGMAFLRAAATVRGSGSAWLSCSECGRSQELATPAIAGGWLLEAATGRCPACRRARGELPPIVDQLA